MKCPPQNSSPSKKLQNTSESILKQSEYGQTKELCSQPEHQVVSDESLSECLIKMKNEPSEPSIAESQVTSKKTTSRGRSTSSKKSTRTTKSTKTSVQGSISKEKDFSPFWTHHCKDWSKRLWSPAEIDFADLHLNSSNGCLNDKVPNLPFSNKLINLQNLNCPTMSFPSFKYSAVEGMVKEDTVTRTLKVKLVLTTGQKRKIRQWEGCARFTYNKSLEFKKQNPRTSKRALRDKFVTKKGNPWFEGYPWLSKCPKAIRQQAVFEMNKNFKVGKQNCRFKKHGIKSWTLGLEKAVTILSNDRIRIFSDDEFNITCPYNGDLPLWLKPEGIDESVPPQEVSLHFDRGDYYLLVPHPVLRTPYQSGTGHMVALDPGIRKFQSSYGTDGRIGYFGKQVGKHFARKQWYKDLITSYLNSKNPALRVSGKKRKTLKKKRSNIQKRMEHIRHNLHHQLANWLVKNYQVIMIGKLPKGIISRNKKLPTTVKRAYNALAHYKFRCVLRDKCLRHGKVYLENDERYTSKTCSHCGHLNDVGSSETYKCSCSPLQWDRDLNGARNIMLKTLSESYLRIVPKGSKTFTLATPVWTMSPEGCSLVYDILQEC
jgi:putative transposase